MNDTDSEHHPAPSSKELWRIATDQLKKQEASYASELLDGGITPPPEAMQALARYLEIAQPAVEVMQAVHDGRAKIQRYKRRRKPVSVEDVRKAQRKRAANFKPPAPLVPSNVMFLFSWVSEAEQKAGTRDFRMKALEAAASMMESNHGITIEVEALARRINRQRKKKGHAT